jgi:hypothetical protein
MRRYLIILLYFLWPLAGCATPPVTTTVEVPVASSCIPKDLGPPPVYPDTNEAIHKAQNLYDRTRLLLAGRDLRNVRLGELEPVIQACSELPVFGK